MITFSALGQQAPHEEKKKWDPDFTRRRKVKALLDKHIPGFPSGWGARHPLMSPSPAFTKLTEFKSSGTPLVFRFRR